jgi:segregation and condensation protein A
MSGIIGAMLPLINPPDVYTVITPVYEGPLDLLLQLIEKAELDITKLSLAIVTDQFLEYINNIQDNSIDNVSSFLVIASRLIQIKSEAILPRPPVRELGEVDPGEALALQLITYKRFKEMANILAERQSREFRTYPRLAPVPRIETSFDLQGLTAEDLLLAAQYIFFQEHGGSFLGMVVSAPKITIRERIKVIAEYIKKHHNGTFEDLFVGKKHRLEVVVTFIALLELVKRKMVLAHQDGIFCEIEFEPAEIWSDELGFDLEFGE